MRRSKLPLILLVALMTFAFTLPAEAADTRARKLGRGISNVMLGIFEIPRNMIDINDSHGDVAGATWGLFRGLERFVIREATGFTEIATFWKADGARIDPEFVFSPNMDTHWRILTDDDRRF